MFDVPILFILYNRPEVTNRVFDEIRKIKPTKLFMAFDGPKESIIGDMEKCLSVRRMLQNRVDWDCTVQTLFQIKNLGGKWGGYTAIKWFFDNVEEGIILEDDDLPNPSFFPYCKELLERYRHVDEIGMISGDNFQFGVNKTKDSYYFSKYMHGWGWATWKRMWNLFDIHMQDWPEKRHLNWMEFDDIREIDFWRKTWDRMYHGAEDAWDYQFCYCLWMNKKLNIIPNTNLITNIGFEGTHSGNRMVNQKSYEMVFPMKHPDKMERFISADKYTLRYYL